MILREVSEGKIGGEQAGSWAPRLIPDLMPDTLVLAVNNPVIVSLVHSLGACWMYPAAVRGLLKMRFLVIQMETTIRLRFVWNIQKSFEIGPYEAF